MLLHQVLCHEFGTSAQLVNSYVDVPKLETKRWPSKIMVVGNVSGYVTSASRGLRLEHLMDNSVLHGRIFNKSEMLAEWDMK